MLDYLDLKLTVITLVYYVAFVRGRLDPRSRYHMCFGVVHQHLAGPSHNYDLAVGVGLCDNIESMILGAGHDLNVGFTGGR